MLLKISNSLKPNHKQSTHCKCFFSCCINKHLVTKELFFRNVSLSSVSALRFLRAQLTLLTALIPKTSGKSTEIFQGETTRVSGSSSNIFREEFRELQGRFLRNSGRQLLRTWGKSSEIIKEWFWGLQERVLRSISAECKQEFRGFQGTVPKTSRRSCENYREEFQELREKVASVSHKLLRQILRATRKFREI